MIDSVTTEVSAIGLLGIIVLLWSASGVMGALRHALNEAWDVKYRRPYLRAKFIDLAMIFGAGILIFLSISTTMFLQVARRVSDNLSESLGLLGTGVSIGTELLVIVIPLLFSFATFLFIFKLVPDVRTRFRYIWPGALLAAVMFEIVKNGFAIYLSFFGDYCAVYGSLGTVVAFLFFIYISASITLLGAEMAAEWPRVMHGHYDNAKEGNGAGQRSTRIGRVFGILATLIGQIEELPHHISDTSGLKLRQARKADEVARRRRLVSRESVILDDSVIGDEQDVAGELETEQQLSDEDPC